MGKGYRMGFWDAIAKMADDSEWGKRNPSMTCPHCQKRGSVRTMAVKRARGISGKKVTLGLLTGGASLLATGLSQKDKVTQAHCDNCENTWDF